MEQAHGRTSRNRSEISGDAADVVQAGRVYGDVHFHGGDRAPVDTPQQLPGNVRSFVNRVAETGDLDAVLEDADPPGVVVITGTAGVGKTSLAVHWAHRVRHRFPQGQLYVNLRGYDLGEPVTAGEVLDRFLRALGVPAGSIPAEPEDRAALYRSRLADQRMLVLLDNAGSVGQVRPLLPGTSDCLVIVTSRSRLSGLVVRNGARRVDLGVLTADESAELLRELTASYRAADDQAELLELARLCARLPLALRIAAERAASRPLMSLADLISDLRDESSLWDALTAEDDEESDAVRTVFAWSYRALPQDAARLFRRLGLHPGPEFGTDAAAALLDGSTAQAKRLLDVLVGAHLIDQRAPGRYQLHDLLRAYAADQALHEESEQDRWLAVRRVLGWYARSAGSALGVIFPHARRPEFAPGDRIAFDDRTRALEWYEAERVNLVAVVRAAAEHGAHETSWRLAALLRNAHANRNEFDDWFTTARIGLASAEQIGDRYGAAELHESLGKAHLQCRGLADSERHHRAALEIRREIDDRPGLLASINALGLVALRARELTEARARFERCADLARQAGDVGWQALAACNLGEVRCELGDIPAAAAQLNTALRRYRERGDRAREGNALFLLSRAQRESGDAPAAHSAISEALALAAEFGNRMWEAYWLTELARVQRALGTPGEALSSYQRSLVLQQQLGDRSREAMALHGIGENYRELGRFGDAADFHRRAAAIHRELGDDWQLAAAADGLAAAAAAGGESERAVDSWREAAGCLRAFEDPVAMAMRERVSRRIRDHSAQA